jgi:zinc protease
VNTHHAPFTNFQRTTLANGLEIFAQRSATAPVVSLWVWYRVGTRNEHPGITGVSHWVEHMLFKGTDRWPSGRADQAISREGGFYNGMTWQDFTTYYETLPVDRLDLALDIESDRMQNAAFREEDVNSERTVIISERQGHENSPRFLLSEEVIGMAYRVHPYGHETIGHLCDLQAMTRDDLQQHYATYYAPNNAVIAVTGDLDPDVMTERVTEAFHEIAEAPPVPSVHLVEPPQRGERRVHIQGAGQTDYVQFAYHIPPAQHEDFHAMTVLNAILSGGSGFIVGRGHITNYTSRLYTALVEEELAINVHGSLAPTVDPDLYTMVATVWPGRTHRDVEARLLEEIDRLHQDKITLAEIEQAKRQAKALFAFSSESISHQAFWLGFSAIFADTDWLTSYLTSLEQVTAEDVQRVAQTYLIPTNRTTGWYLAPSQQRQGPA